MSRTTDDPRATENHPNPSDRLPPEHAPTSCYILRLIYENKKGPATPQCPQMPTDLLSAAVEAAAPWRDPPHRIRRIRALIKEHALPGIALTYEVKTAPRGFASTIPVPPPFDVPFEPTPLNEAVPRLIELVRLVNTKVPVGTRTAEPASRKRVLARWLVDLFILIPCGFFVLIKLAGLAFRGLTAGPVLELFLAILLALLGVALTRGWFSGQWLIVPGGVIVRRAAFWRVGVGLRRYVPRDSVLMLTPQGAAWKAEIYRDNKPISRALTELEAVALLAAWQSPIEPLPLERISDLQ
ncbi:MAG: hypothetical protein JXQ73_15150 [Phycisphaerae bacterium]|nr:hypothetical protein [Phycisphaerae bacterium]